MKPLYSHTLASEEKIANESVGPPAPLALRVPYRMPLMSIWHLQSSLTLITPKQRLCNCEIASLILSQNAREGNFKESCTSEIPLHMLRWRVCGDLLDISLWKKTDDVCHYYLKT